MAFDLVSAAIAGVGGTAIMTVFMAVAAPMMGFTMDMPMMLGTMLTKKGRVAWWLGLMMHAMMGAIFFIVYALLFDAFGLSGSLWLWGGAFGAAHGVMTGMAMGMMATVHPRIARHGAESDVALPDPGFMGMSLAPMAPVGIVMVHIVYGVFASLVYTKLA